MTQKHNRRTLITRNKIILIGDISNIFFISLSVVYILLKNEEKLPNYFNFLKILGHFEQIGDISNIFFILLSVVYILLKKLRKLPPYINFLKILRHFEQPQ